jgi:transmembrane sensor
MQTELERRLEQAGQQVRVHWSEARAAHVRGGIAPKHRAARRRVVLQAAAGVIVVLLGAGALGLRLTSPHTVVTPSAPGSEWVMAQDDASATEISLRRGGAWFDVPPQPAGHPFRVRARDVVVEVVGTRFLVEEGGDEVRVAVEHGTVRVRWPGGERLLSQGERGAFPPPRVEPPPLAEVPAPRPESLEQVREPASGDAGILAPAPRGRESRRTTKPWRPPEWRRLAELGDYARAFEALQASPEPPRDETQELLLAADVARLSHHPTEALAPLRRVVERHSEDPRAALAAFTLGRVLLDELGRPRESAGAFARARTLAPEGPLAEDALAREVEAMSRAGEVARARSLALAYEATYPGGARLRAVRRHGGLE